MHERYTNRKRYFDEQAYTTQQYVIPFISRVKEIKSGMHVLEIGCSEAGNLKPFLDMGCHCVGIDIAEAQIEHARKFYTDHPQRDHLELVAEDIYKIGDAYNGRFHLIVMRDVIEHIPDQEQLMGLIKKFLKPDGKVFFGFPPWYNPFGGHHQICESKWLSKLPYIHLLPGPLYPMMLRLFGEPEGRVQHLLEVKETGISIERFWRALRNNGYHTDLEALYLFNPNYQIKFNLKPKEQYGLIKVLPFLRNFLTTCVYSVVSEKPLSASTNEP